MVAVTSARLLPIMPCPRPPEPSLLPPSSCAALLSAGRSLCVPVALSLVCFASGRKYNAVGAKALFRSLRQHPHVSLLCPCPHLQKVAVTGDLDLQGNILDVGGLEGKIEVCHRKGVSLLLIPATSLAVSTHTHLRAALPWTPQQC